MELLKYVRGSDKELINTIKLKERSKEKELS